MLIIDKNKSPDNRSIEDGFRYYDEDLVCFHGKRDVH